MSRLRRPVAAAAATGLSMLAACSGSASDRPDDSEETRPAAAPAPVEVALSGLSDEPLKVGIIVSPSGGPGQGSDVLAGAAGAKVAAYRLGLGGADVELVVVDDQGTSKGVRRAVRRLAGEDVAGIAALTTGSHLDPGLDAAADAGLPVLLPYYRIPGDEVPAGVWLTGPELPTTSAAMQEAFRLADVDRPFLLSADGVRAGVLEPVSTRALNGSDPEAAVAQAVRAVEDGSADGVVVAASAATQARVVSELQGHALEVPVVLTPEALSPTFGSYLTEQGGTTAGELLTVGVDASDATTLGNGADADRVAAFFTALRLATGDQQVTDLFGDTSFAAVAAQADTPSHDAVIAIAAAAAAARSTASGDVARALEGLTVQGDDGLAGPDLHFSDAAALPKGRVVPLVSTNQDPGVRPPSDANALFWFASAPAQTSGSEQGG